MFFFYFWNAANHLVATKTLEHAVRVAVRTVICSQMSQLHSYQNLACKWTDYCLINSLEAQVKSCQDLTWNA